MKVNNEFNTKILQLLLVKKANPFNTKYINYTALAKSYVVKKMLSVCRRVFNYFMNIYHFLILLLGIDTLVLKSR